MYVIFTIAFNQTKIIGQLSEGITLLQSIAVIYWTVDLHIYEQSNFFMKLLLLIGLIISAFTFFNALTPFSLTRKKRFILSIWSCVIMLLFAADNILAIYRLDPIEASIDLSSGIFIAMQHFLFGISIIYVILNFAMLSSFLPGKGTFFNAQYYTNIDELKETHIERYSDEQVSLIRSIFCIGLAIAVFYLNYSYQFVPRNFAIWTLFTFFPLLLYLFDLILHKNKNWRTLKNKGSL